jgi:hypothetical protein
MYGCATVLALSTIPSRDSQLLFVISEFRPNVGDVEYARLILPLVWFRVNRVVSYSYPLKTRAPEEPAPMALVDVHLARGGIAPFACPHAPLKVVPTWEVPLCMRPPDAGLSEPPAPKPTAPDEPPPVRMPSVIPPEVDSWLQANTNADE